MFNRKKAPDPEELRQTSRQRQQQQAMTFEQECDTYLAPAIDVSLQSVVNGVIPEVQQFGDKLHLSYWHAADAVTVWVRTNYLPENLRIARQVEGWMQHAYPGYQLAYGFLDRDVHELKHGLDELLRWHGPDDGTWLLVGVRVPR